MHTLLDIQKLSASIEDTSILEELSLKVHAGEIHAIMGPNGAGKSTLAKALAGHPSYEVKGSVNLLGEELLELDPEERCHKGLFMSFQYPVEIPGVSNVQFLHAAYNAQKKARDEETLDEAAFEQLLDEKMEQLKIPAEFKTRNVNENFSGGEKKRNEILQMAILNPSVSILDETDSGLDIDAMRTVAEGVNNLMTPEKGLILITHYQRLLDHISPDFVHVLIDGKIVESGGPELAQKLEEQGYDWLATEEAL